MNAPTAAQLAVTLAGDKQALAQADLQTIQTFTSSLVSGAWARAALLAAVQAMVDALGDPDRRDTAKTLAANLSAVFGQFDALEAEAAATAGAQP